MTELMDNKEIGRKIKERRLELGWTQKELGAKMGVRNTAVNKWELGLIKNLKVPVIKHLALVLGLSPLALIGFNNERLLEDDCNDLPSSRSKHLQIWNDIFKDVEFSDDEFNEVLKYAKFLISQRK